MVLTVGADLVSNFCLSVELTSATHQCTHYCHLSSSVELPSMALQLILDYIRFHMCLKNLFYFSRMNVGTGTGRPNPQGSFSLWLYQCHPGE